MTSDYDATIAVVTRCRARTDRRKEPLSQPSPSNEELLARYRNADFEGFDLFYKRHHALLLQFLCSRLGNRADAEEVFQETFIRIHNSILTYDPRQSALAWVFTIARNTAVDHARKRGRQSIPNGETEEVAVAARDEAALAARQELARLAARLTDEERELLESRFISDDSFEEIAERQGISSANARQKLSRLLKKVKSGEAP
jgi:RNA polymerase sigma-70 factor (ECF subfamily)